MAEKDAPDTPSSPPDPPDPPDPGKATKPAWVKPVIRASGDFDMQALACAPEVQQFGPPFCQGGVS